MRWIAKFLFKTIAAIIMAAILLMPIEFLLAHLGFNIPNNIKIILWGATIILFNILISIEYKIEIKKIIRYNSRKLEELEELEELEKLKKNKRRRK